MFIQTTATKKIKACRKRIRGISGGASASKTISILLWLIGYSQSQENKIVSTVSETLPHLKKGAMRDFEIIMKEHGYWDQKRFNKTESIYTFETGTIMEFFSADQPDKVRGPRRDVLFLNECNNVSLETYNQLEIRTREIIWLDWNPVSEFWWYTDIAPFYDHDFLKLTYLDNEGLTPQEVESFEKHKRNPRRVNWWKVYGKGELGEAEGRIYKGWDIVDEVPRDARLEGYGLDFGYTNDPTAIVAIYRYNDGFVLDELCYNRGMTNRQIADLIFQYKEGLVIADSAEPKSIDEIKGYGVMIVGATKGQGSVSQGIQFVQDQKIAITKDSLNLIKEYRNYLWLTDRDGKPLNVPQDYLDHLMDAVRYGFSKKFIDYEPEPEMNYPDPEILAEHGVALPFGGIEGYQGEVGFGMQRPVGLPTR